MGGWIRLCLDRTDHPPLPPTLHTPTPTNQSIYQAVAVLLAPDPQPMVSAATAALRTHFGVTDKGDVGKVGVAFSVIIIMLGTPIHGVWH